MNYVMKILNLILFTIKELANNELFQVFSFFMILILVFDIFYKLIFIGDSL